VLFAFCQYSVYLLSGNIHLLTPAIVVPREEAEVSIHRKGAKIAKKIKYNSSK
jgi:hypothetical protein